MFEELEDLTYGPEGLGQNVSVPEKAIFPNANGFYLPANVLFIEIY